ncbi:MAG: 4-alpha-glucanotransferase [Pyrinomonadaceae bacterium]
MNFPRASGILLHPTSLPSAFDIGDFGVEAFHFVDFLNETGQTYWQLLPLGPTGYGDSPYQCYSAFAGNTNLISPEKLVEENLLTEEEIAQKPDFPEDRIDYGKVFEWKNRILEKAYERFKSIEDANLKEDFDRFTQDSAFWLEDYALFRAIGFSLEEQKPWYEWNKSLKLREKKALNKARKDLSGEIEAQKFYQFLFFRQWMRLKEYANEKGVKIIGDVPIYVSLNSSDVWCNPQYFKLNKDLSPKTVAGVPPDYFSETGQLWGNPIYDWEMMKSDNFRWWIERLRSTLEMFDIARIDHFIGFVRCWEVPGGDETAANGQWVEVPGRELFEALKNALGDLPFIAEDLGVLTPEVEELRDSLNLPGMRILQYAFGGDAKNSYLPHNYIKNCVAYTGTHDNDTTAGWFYSAKQEEREFCKKYLKTNGERIHWDFIRGIFSSVADTAIVPMQDVLGLGNDARMNVPASTSGNWNWRLQKNVVTGDAITILKELTGIFDRKP